MGRNASKPKDGGWRTGRLHSPRQLQLQQLRLEHQQVERGGQGAWRRLVYTKGCGLQPGLREDAHPQAAGAG